MEIEYSVDAVKPCNFTRKRQAVLESCTEQRMKKRPCLENSSWQTENNFNLETENRLPCCTTQRVAEARHPSVCNQPLRDPNSTTVNVHIDINCNIVNEVNNVQEMEIAYDSANVVQSQEQLHQLSSSIPALLTANHSLSPSCPRCLTGESGHINHLQHSS